MLSIKTIKSFQKNEILKPYHLGEKQILITFNLFKISRQKWYNFIIDEPELSLHPKWQEDFLAAVEALTPKNTQLIIATHSPIIVGNNADYCKVLLPYNN
ncbi:MAG: ATP-binding protein [Chitinophagaceae bacterium]|nr:ATP-binding protein [Chitinophagaceae bacterium]